MHDAARPIRPFIRVSQPHQVVKCGVAGDSEGAAGLLEILVNNLHRRARFQEDMPMQMFVFPVNPQAKLPDAFVKHAQIPSHPATLAPDDIAKNRDAWIQRWTETVLR